MPALLGIAQGVGGVVAAAAFIVILSLYWGINQIHFERLWLSLLPSDQRKLVAYKRKHSAIASRGMTITILQQTFFELQPGRRDQQNALYNRDHLECGQITRRLELATLPFRPIKLLWVATLPMLRGSLCTYPGKLLPVVRD